MKANKTTIVMMKADRDWWFEWLFLVKKITIWKIIIIKIREDSFKVAHLNLCSPGICFLCYISNQKLATVGFCFYQDIFNVLLYLHHDGVYSLSTENPLNQVALLPIIKRQNVSPNSAHLDICFQVLLFKTLQTSDYKFSVIHKVNILVLSLKHILRHATAFF